MPEVVCDDSSLQKVIAWDLVHSMLRIGPFDKEKIGKHTIVSIFRDSKEVTRTLVFEVSITNQSKQSNSTNEVKESLKKDRVMPVFEVIQDEDTVLMLET